jgi:hypothetical protein
LKDSTQIQGDKNVIIQNVTDSTITISYNGEMREIRNELVGLKQLLKQSHIGTFNVSDITYDINDITDDNFEYVVGKKAFNEVLTKQLVLALKSYSPAAAKFLEKANISSSNWEIQSRISDIAKDIISYSFVGILGIQLRKLMAIGKEELSPNKIRKYIENCLLTSKRSLQLLTFTLLSQFWNYAKGNKVILSDRESVVLQNFFDDGFEMDIPTGLELLTTLINLFQDNNLDFIVSELSGIYPHIAEHSDFQKACSHLHTINGKFDRDRVSLVDCYEVENHLTTVLVTFSFLANYKMVSIKNIGYDEMRNNPPHFLHHYTTLGLDNKFNFNAEKVNYVKNAVSSDAILLFKGDYDQGVNLFPFVIDINALAFEEGSKICFYCCRDITDGSLNFRFLEDNSLENIVFRNILRPETEINELMMDKEKRKYLKLDAVIQQFQEAERVILNHF